MKLFLGHQLYYSILKTMFSWNSCTWVVNIWLDGPWTQNIVLAVMVRVERPAALQMGQLEWNLVCRSEIMGFKIKYFCGPTVTKWYVLFLTDSFVRDIFHVETELEINILNIKNLQYSILCCAKPWIFSKM